MKASREIRYSQAVVLAKAEDGVDSGLEVED